MVMERNFQHGRKYEVSERRKTQVKVKKEKEKEGSTLHQRGCSLMYSQGGRRRQRPVFSQSVMNTTRGPRLPWLREKGLILPAVFEPT